MRPVKRAPDYVAVANFRAALREFDNAAEAAARDAGLTFQRYLLLLMVKGAPAGDERATANEIASRLKVAPHSITGAVKRAEEAGLLQRERCTEDRRRMWIRLTPKGERSLERVVTALAQQRDALLSVVDGAADGVHSIAAHDTSRSPGPSRKRVSS